MVRDSMVNNNVAVDSGGGIHKQFGSMKIIRSALIGNSSTSWGGAVAFSGNGGDELLVLNSTFSGNSADDGGAIYQGPTVGAWLGNVTMVDNSATVAGGADDIRADGASVTVSNSILTHPAGSANPECSGAAAFAIGGSRNLIDTATSCFGTAGNFRLGQIAAGALGPLGFHGGPTKSYSLVPVGGGAGDPVDAVIGGCFDPRSPLTALIYDQNLSPRPVGAGARCDIGSVER